MPEKYRIINRPVSSWLVSALLTLVSGLATAQDDRPFIEVRGSLSGSWYDPSKDGQGFVLELSNIPSGTVATIYWFTHRNGEPYWLIGSTSYDPMMFDKDGMLLFDMFEVAGTGFGDNFVSEDLSREIKGVIGFEFDGCNAAEAVWTPLSGSDLGSGSDGLHFKLERITQTLDGISCREPVTVPDQNEEPVTLSNVISQSMTLSGEYLITESVKIEEGVTVTVDAGSILRFEAETGIIVVGNLVVKGTSDNPVYLTCSGSCQTEKSRSGRWLGVQLQGSRSSRFEGVLVEGAYNAFSLDGISPLSLSNSTIRNNVFAVFDPSGYQPVEIKNNEFYDHFEVFKVRTSGESFIADNIFRQVLGPIFNNSFYFDTTIVTGNNFEVSNTDPEYVLLTAPEEGFGYGNIEAAENWWGTRDKARIESMIFDSRDDATLKSIVYEPFRDTPNPTAGPYRK